MSVNVRIFANAAPSAQIKASFLQCCRKLALALAALGARNLGEQPVRVMVFWSGWETSNLADFPFWPRRPGPICARKPPARVGGERLQPRGRILGASMF